MPSSSNHNTYLERQILDLFRATYLKILILPRGESARQQIVIWFAELLDVERTELAQVLIPTRTPAFPTPVTYEERKFWFDFRIQACRLSEKQMLLGAAESLADVGAALIAVGRASEAGKWCEAAAGFEEAGWKAEAEARETKWDCEEIR
ncbi:hypothetical protein BAUCODRAFT_36359 [Baudoinia panamericana UAMH 10762]|uniref:Uncharacterized protein n=1 Tax=Baudoinia panamericana (strain UAMH 10762) TaxID=717646 RepID=M2LIB3_BAUPA|nr:uncharacterized protein BAUCODRAFT_36359 [Baudoinia panamericana UAMH 10762]EMC93907.1 hypothetical protein BAUCODRAFT_36359 [Baudoinia panamericana UAMH 10762]